MKQKDFLSDFIGDQARARLLRIFIFIESESYNLALVVKRAGITTPAARRALRELESLGIIVKAKALPIPTLKNGKLIKDSVSRPEVVWTLNGEFEHFRAVSNFVHEATPARYDTITTALKRTGRLATIVLSGNFMGDPTRPADLLMAADGINKQRLEVALKGLEQTFGREIRYAAFTTPEFRYRLTVQDRLIRDTLDFPHLVLLDRTRLL